MDNDAVCASGVWGGTLTDEADPPPPEQATIPHANTTAKAPHPARHHRRPRRRPDEPDDDSPDDAGAPDGGRTGNHDTEELLPQGP